MAVVAFATVLLNLASDPSQLLTLDFVTDIDLSPITPGEDRSYGAGRLRSVNTGTSQQQAAIIATGVEPSIVTTLRLWATVPICYRDDSGAKFYGTFRSPKLVRRKYCANDYYDVSFTVTETTYLTPV